MPIHGYAGWKRAAEALASKETRLIDNPLAGQLGEGTHTVTIQEIHAAQSFIDVVFANSHGTFTQRIYKNDDAHVEALEAACRTDINDGTGRVLIGKRLKLTLAYNDDGYRIAVNALGYLALLPHDNWRRIAGPCAELRELRQDVGTKPQATLEIVEYDHDNSTAGAHHA